MILPLLLLLLLLLPPPPIDLQSFVAATRR
jgi:hypothetical protein